MSTTDLTVRYTPAATPDERGAVERAHQDATGQYAHDRRDRHARQLAVAVLEAAAEELWRMGPEHYPSSGHLRGIAHDVRLHGLERTPDGQ